MILISLGKDKDKLLEEVTASLVGFLILHRHFQRLPGHLRNSNAVMAAEVGGKCLDGVLAVRNAEQLWLVLAYLLE